MSRLFISNLGNEFREWRLKELDVHNIVKSPSSSAAHRRLSGVWLRAVRAHVRKVKDITYASPSTIGWYAAHMFVYWNTPKLTAQQNKCDETNKYR